jgi:hypothetical protein
MAADPYDTPEKAAVFAVDYRQYEYLPIRLIISNDSGEPIQLANSRIQLVTRNKTKIEPSTPDDLYRRLGKTSRRGDSPRVALPIPQGPKVGVGKNVKQEIETFRFQAKAVEPHSIQAGFLFFNVSDIDNPLSGAHLYITDVRNNSGADLLYFDVALDEYLAHQSAQAAPRSAPK